METLRLSSKGAMVHLSFLVVLGIAHGQIPAPDDAPLPLPPAESKKHFTLPEGFRIDLVAAEPLIRDPSCVAWDAGGRLFVTEIHGYNLEGHLDVTELNRAGKLDTAIRRVRVGPELKQKAQSGQTGSLKLLLDTDGNGRMDTVIPWAEDIPAAYGVVAVNGGVIVTAAPHILFFADTDGDNKPDVRRTLFTGFTIGEMERAINNPVIGPDGWIYTSQGWGGGTISGPDLAEPVKMGRTDFRFKPDGSAIEPVSGSNHTFGMAFDDAGNRFLITTSRPALYAAPLPYAYLKRNPHVATPELTITASNYHNTFPSSRPHPWRRKRGADPRWVRFYGAGEAKPNGNFTSACGQQVYRAKLFPEKYHGNYFCCDPQQSMVHRALIERDGPGIRVRRHPEQANAEFLTSSDGWFRPNNLRVGPDGALYIVDMYREIIEDYSAIPRYLQQQYGLLNGDDRGRIWRLAPEDSPPRPLTSGRFEAARPLAGRIKALYAPGAKLSTALADPHYAVRLHALRAADPRLGSDRALMDQVLALSKTESDPGVLLQLALSLGESHDPRAIPVLARLAAEHGTIRWMDNAVLSSIGDKAGAFLKCALLEQHTIAVSILERAAETAARTGDAAALLAAADHPDPALRLRLLGLAARHGGGAPDSLRTAADQALSADKQSDPERLAALPLLAYASEAVVQSAMKRLLSPNENPDFQAKAINTAMSAAQAQVAAPLMAHLPRATPRLASVIVEALMSRSGTTKQLLSAGHRVSFSTLQRHRLRHHDDPEIRRLSEALSRGLGPRVSAAISHKRYYAALEGQTDLARGATLFTTHCAVCHQLAGQGIAVGPQLDGEVGRPAESLLADILTPSAEITAGYATYMAKMRGGASHTGVLAAESATSLELLQAAGARIELLRSELLSLNRLDLSLMPGTLAELLRPEELADIIGFMKHGQNSQVVVLFDDDPAFPGALGDGKGTAALDWGDASSGRACLVVAGFQRYARQVPGWNFAVREQPVEGEFRYLRLAMKTVDAKGMMIELAADGKFPPNDRAIRTYYAGMNSTGWKSNALAKEVPTQWQRFTIDLWQGNGNFTLSGIAFTTMGGKGRYDRIELLRNKP
jgi:putative membrane-bound dehydrogenase-like protein